ncbi:MAG TPA: FecR domain-containing protein [Candidatus Omnitrophota bacterium]|nr:FecR domain-containing protein [Candidatus Omnitrophota bacterium]HPS36769.1 FecR domain-containing protein [Candidatus Omnitrophota bacterium]
MKLRIEKPKARNFITPVVVVLLIAGLFFVLPRLVAQKSLPTLAFEIMSFEGDSQIYDLQTRAWRTPKRGEEFRASQKLRTGTDGIINFQVENEIRLRLKENSLLENRECGVLKLKEIYKLFLERGVLFGATTKTFDRKEAAKKALFQILTGEFLTTIHGALFRIQSGSTKAEENKVGVLRGSVEASVPSFFFGKAGVRIRGLEEAALIDGALQPAAKVSQQQWGDMKEAYELLERSAVMEAEQIDLSKKAGSFFDRVFDHGTFYTPKSGFANREFYKDADTGETYLETEYDVFPVGSFAGVYIKTRDLDAAQYEGLSFEVRRKPEEGVPDSFYIELKSKGNVVRRFAPRGFVREWTPMHFDFQAKKTTPVNEVTFVFTNARAGEAKKGFLEFRNLNLIPRKTPLPAPVTAKVPSKVSAKSVQAVASKPSVAKPASRPEPAPERVPIPKEIPLQ